jgi:hypothetical protein
VRPVHHDTVFLWLIVSEPQQGDHLVHRAFFIMLFISALVMWEYFSLWEEIWPGRCIAIYLRIYGRGGSVKLSETLNDFLHELDSAEGWAESDRHDREVAADFEAFTLPSRALITSILRKYRRDHLEDSLDSYYVRKVLRDAPKLVLRTLQLETMATQEIPQTNGAFYLREATRCYIHGFWGACVALSRAAVEQALKEAVAKAVGATASDSKLSTLVESARRLRLADPAVLSLADEVRIAGNRTVHNKASDQPEAWDTLVRVRAVLLALYEGQVPDVPEIQT